MNCILGLFAFSVHSLFPAAGSLELIWIEIVQPCVITLMAFFSGKKNQLNIKNWQSLHVKSRDAKLQHRKGNLFTHIPQIRWFFPDSTLTPAPPTHSNLFIIKHHKRSLHQLGAKNLSEYDSPRKDNVKY